MQADPLCLLVSKLRPLEKHIRFKKFLRVKKKERLETGICDNWFVI